MPPKLDTPIFINNDNKSFFNDCIALFQGKKTGNLYQYLYSSPKNSKDPVCGSILYERILSEETNYYLYEFESRLIKENAKKIASIVGENPTIIEFGAGGDLSVRQKTLPFLHALMRPMEYISIDISPSLLTDCLEMVGLAMPELLVRGICSDFTQIDTIVYEMCDKPVVFFPGSTIANFNPCEISVFVKKVNKIVSPKGFFIVGQDTNQDEGSLMRAYRNQHTDNFIKNILWRIKRDLGANELQPDYFVYSPKWNAATFEFQHIFVVNKKNQFQILDETIYLKEGQNLHIASSFKYPAQFFKDMLISAGFDSDTIFLDKHKRMALHVLSGQL